MQLLVTIVYRLLLLVLWQALILLLRMAMGFKMIPIVTQEANLKVCLIISFFTFLEYKTWYIFKRPFIAL